MTFCDHIFCDSGLLRAGVTWPPPFPLHLGQNVSSITIVEEHVVNKVNGVGLILAIPKSTRKSTCPEIGKRPNSYKTVEHKMV